MDCTLIRTRESDSNSSARCPDQKGNRTRKHHVCDETLPPWLSVCKCVINVTSSSAGNFAHELFLERNGSATVSSLQKVRGHPVRPLRLVKPYVIYEDTAMNVSWPCKVFVSRLES